MNTEKLKLVRIDFRLIHGQVMAYWSKQLEIESIVVVDDKSYTSPLLKKILLGAAPAGIDVTIESVETAAQKWKENVLPQNKLLILYRNTNTALRAHKAGIVVPELQVGGIEGSSSKKSVFRNVLASQEEMDELKEISDDGVNVYFQILPTDPKYPFEEGYKKF